MASSPKTLFRSVPALASNANVAACVVLACGCYMVWGFMQNLTFSIDRYLTSYGYSRNPPKVPLSEEVSKDDNNPFNRGSWDCANRLFKKVTIDHKSPAVTTKKVSSESVSKLFSYVPSSNNSSPVIPFLVSPHIKESLVVCALVDLREGTDKTYFKSEVAGKSVSEGWILWSGYSKDRFEHRLIILKFKFEKDKWEIDKQFFWKKADDMNVYIGGDGSSKDFTLGTVATERKNWKETKENVGEGYTSRKVWSGIGTIKAEQAIKPITDKSIEWTTCEKWSRLKLGNLRGLRGRRYINNEEISRVCYTKPDA